MTTKIKWRLSKLPTSEEVSILVKDDILTKDEAREILFSQETEEDLDINNLKDEIKFLRALVDRMSTRSQIITYIPQVATPSVTSKPWYQPYQVWCSAQSLGADTTNAIWTAGNDVYTLQGSASLVHDALDSQLGGLTLSYTNTTEPAFSDIKTF